MRAGVKALEADAAKHDQLRQLANEMLQDMAESIRTIMSKLSQIIQSAYESRVTKA